MAAIEDSVTVTRDVRPQGLAPGLSAHLSPATVDVILSGPVPLLKALRASDVEVYVDLSDLTPGSYQLQVSYRVLLEGVQVEALLPAQIAVTITAGASPGSSPHNPLPMAIRKPVVALVGRPNVGKSTLFNRLIGERRAVVDEVPGTTRDRLVAEGEWSGRVFDVVDTGGIDPSHMGAPGATPLSIGSADFIPQIRAQAEMAIRDAEVVLFITDGQSGVTPADLEIADILRRHQHKEGDRLQPPVILVVNKCESAIVRQNVFAFYELGMGEPQAISALHGTGVGDLLDELVEALPGRRRIGAGCTHSVGHRGQTQRRQEQPAQPAAGRGTRDRQPHPRHDSRRDRHPA